MSSMVAAPKPRSPKMRRAALRIAVRVFSRRSAWVAMAILYTSSVSWPIDLPTGGRQYTDCQSVSSERKMPSLATLQAFAAAVESNDHVGAIQQFYAPDARTRENDGEWRVGREALAERERAVLASVASVKTTRLGPLLLNDRHSAICWRFEFTGRDG